MHSEAGSVIREPLLYNKYLTRGRLGPADDLSHEIGSLKVLGLCISKRSPLKKARPPLNVLVSIPSHSFL